MTHVRHWMDAKAASQHTRIPVEEVRAAMLRGDMGPGAKIDHQVGGPCALVEDDVDEWARRRAGGSPTLAEEVAEDPLDDALERAAKQLKLDPDELRRGAKGQ